MRTRRAIAQAARSLFLERGFQAVTVAQVAEAAEVSQATVFNYFATKEDLFFSGMEVFERELIAAVRDRPPGEPVMEAFRRFVIERLDGLARPEAAQAIGAAGRMLAETRSLRDRERALIADQTRALATAISADLGTSGRSVEVSVVANALMGVHAALIERSRSLVMGGVEGEELARAVTDEAKRAFDALERGIADYAAKPI